MFEIIFFTLLIWAAVFLAFELFRRNEEKSGARLVERDPDPEIRGDSAQD